MAELRVIFTAAEIRDRVAEVAQRIAEDYQKESIVLVGILKGAAFFLADLARTIDAQIDFDFVDVTTSAGERGEVVSLTYATRFDVKEKNVLILKDVLHSGVTENYLITHLSQQHPASIEVVALVDKPQLRSVNVNAKYSVFADVPEGYLVGYGLGGGTDQFTNQPDLCILED
jgi:hypoxanthine phosphoribosyltransferase